MLTADLIKPRLRVRGDMLTVDMIDPANVHWLRTPFELIALFQAQVGQTAAAWESAVERHEGERGEYVAVRGLEKVLADAATVTSVNTKIDPAALRTPPLARTPASG